MKMYHNGPRKGMMYGGNVRKPMGFKAGTSMGGIPKTPKQKKFAALADPKDMITAADRIAGAKGGMMYGGKIKDKK